MSISKNLSIFLVLFMLLTIFIPILSPTVAYAANTETWEDKDGDGKDDNTGLVEEAWKIQYGSSGGSYNNPNDVKVLIGQDGSVNISGGGFGKDKVSTWNDFISKYQAVITGISGLGAVTMIIFFIVSFLKLGASAGNPTMRSQALTGCLWTGIATAALGSVCLICGFFYSAIGK